MASELPVRLAEVVTPTSATAEGSSAGNSLDGRKLELPVAPPDLPPPVQEVVKLAQSTLGDGVLLGYIGNITTPYSLNADQIIYLNDLGLSDPVIQQLVKHASIDSAAAGISSMQNQAIVSNSPASSPKPSMIDPTNTSAADGTGAIHRYLPSTAPSTTGPGTSGSPLVQYDVVPPTNYVVVQQPAQPVTQQLFVDSLSPYGVWVDDSDYGQVWQPTVAVVNPSWRPYCDNGYWAWSDCGWYWQSTYSWGWAPFHYGRWCRTVRRGWCWAPDTCWGPAWVTWRTCDTHCGWAPLPPHCVWSPAGGFVYRGNHVGVGFGFGLGYDSFVYIGWGHFCDRTPWRHCAPRSEVVGIHSHTRIVNDIHGRENTIVHVAGNHNTVIINNGPGILPVQAHTKTEIKRVPIADASRPTLVGNRDRMGPGRSEVISAYRPSMSGPSPANTLPARPATGMVLHSTASSSTPVPARPYLGVTTPGISHPPTISGPQSGLAGASAPMAPRQNHSVNSGTVGTRPPPIPSNVQATTFGHGEAPARPSIPTPSSPAFNPYPSRTTTVPSRGEIAARPVPQNGMNSAGGSGPTRTVPRPTPISGMAETSAREMPSMGPARTAQTQPSDVGIFGNSGTRIEPGQMNRPTLQPPGNTPVYRYYSPAGNNAPVARYYNPSAGIPPRSGPPSPAPNYSPSANNRPNPGPAVPPPSRSTKNGR